MAKHAKGHNAWGECQRSGKRVRYRDLVEDGHIPGLLVAPDWWEPEHPQETPPRVDDPVALARPAPEISIPDGEGTPETTGGVTCAAAPDDDTYLPTTVLAADWASGSTVVPIEMAAKYLMGQCIYVQRDDDSWFVSKSVSEAGSPAYTIPIMTGATLAGSTFSAGNSVYIGVDGGGQLIPVANPDGFIMVLTQSTGTERPAVIISNDDIETWTESQFVGDPQPTGNQIADRNDLHYHNGVWMSAGDKVGTGTNSEGIWGSEDDGATWQQKPGYEANMNFECITYGDFGNSPAWAAFGSNHASGQFQYGYSFSDTGAEWFGANGPENELMLDVIPHPTLGLMSVGQGGKFWRRHSTSSANNAEVVLPVEGRMEAIARNGTDGRLFIGGTDDVVFWSDDEGDTWTQMVGDALSDRIRGIAQNDEGTVVAVGDSQDILVSIDNGVNFSTVAVLPAGGEFHDVIYDAGTTEPYGFVAVGEISGFATVYTSSDGLTWTHRFTSTTADSVALTVRGKNTL